GADHGRDRGSVSVSALARASLRPRVRAPLGRGVPRAAEGIRVTEVGGAPSGAQLEAIARGGKISSLTLGRRGKSLLKGVVPPLGAFVIFVGIAYFFSYVLLSPSRRF